MKDKLLDELLAIAHSKRPNWAQVRVRVRASDGNLICGKKLHHIENSELGLCLELLDRERTIKKLQKPKKKAKKAE
jgi:hypothetical protein